MHAQEDVISSTPKTPQSVLDIRILQKQLLSPTTQLSPLVHIGIQKLCNIAKSVISEQVILHCLYKAMQHWIQQKMQQEEYNLL